MISYIILLYHPNCFLLHLKEHCYRSPQKCFVICHSQRALLSVTPKMFCSLSFQKGPVIYQPQSVLSFQQDHYLSHQKCSIICHSKRALLFVTPKVMFTVIPKGPCYLSTQKCFVICHSKKGPAICHSKRALLHVTPKSYVTVTPKEPCLSPSKGSISVTSKEPCYLSFSKWTQYVLPKEPYYL